MVSKRKLNIWWDFCKTGGHFGDEQHPQPVSTPDEHTALYLTLVKDVSVIRLEFASLSALSINAHKVSRQILALEMKRMDYDSNEGRDFKSRCRGFICPWVDIAGVSYVQLRAVSLETVNVLLWTEGKKVKEE